MVIRKGLDSKYKAIISEHMFIDQDGYLICKDAILGRAGIYKYVGTSLGLDTDKIIEVVRDEDQVFDSESLKSLEHRPITINHPNEEVTIDNVNKYAKGEVYNVRRDGNNIIGDLIIKDKVLKEKILNKEVKELSLGYRQDLIYEEDTKLYKLKNIIYNHLAFVKKGRAGNAMVLDGVENIQEEEKKDEVVEDACSKDEVEEKVEEAKEVVEETKEEVKEETEVEDAKEEKEEVVETAKEEEKAEDEVKEEEKVEDSEENTTVPRADENKKVDNYSTQTTTEDLREVEETEEKEKEEEKDTMVKDSAYFLEKQKEIAKIEDAKLRNKMALILDNEMDEFISNQPKVEADIVCDTVETNDEEEAIEPTMSYEQQMQDYYDRFNPKNYNDPNKALAFYKSECKNINAKKFDD